jgi:hypothetical protein
MKFKKEPAKLPNGEIDCLQVDVHNDFRLFDKLFNCVEDIEKFIVDYKVDVPVLNRVLQLRKNNELELTPTETQFYFDNLFDYIYDVYRIPVEYTYVKTKNWLEYIESELVNSGMNGVKIDSYNELYYRWEMESRYDESLQVHPKELINYHTDIGETNPYYNCSNAIESFWIKTGSNGQPVGVDDEYYMRVCVKDNSVYIFWCDDCSWTLYTKDVEESKRFALYLKTYAPVWNFSYPQLIHPKLEFTN